MPRFKNCKVKVAKEEAIRLVCYRYKSVANYCRQKQISRARFYEIMNSPHRSPNEKCLLDLSWDLGVSVNAITIKEE